MCFVIQLMYNVGVYGVPTGGAADPVQLNRSIETRVSKLGGRKMLYAQSFYSPEEFWALYDQKKYLENRAAVGLNKGGACEGVLPMIDSKLLLPARTLAAMSGVKKISLLQGNNPHGDSVAMAIWSNTYTHRAIILTW